MLQPDTLLGTYRLIGRIGVGGMGEVWKAEDTRLGRVVAIKILPPAVASDADAIARMKREARTAAQLYHPNIATIHAFEEIDDRLFIVMEFVEGESLARALHRGKIAEAEICRIGRSVADALAEAHEKGIV
ncbi:MAG TPA: serine/threonine-protein kinase, partial [Thermoanaerobaculia bacterium]|nr:serine/threonine-protein kinase [Thermoanaerobaculia bacterium]